MTDRKNPDRDLEDFLRGEGDLSKLYREARGTASPSPDTDDRILTMAREEALKVPRLRPRWIQPLALAATVVLSMSVLLNILVNPDTRDAAVPTASPDHIEPMSLPGGAEDSLPPNTTDDNRSGERSDAEAEAEASAERKASASAALVREAAGAPPPKPPAASAKTETEKARGALRKPWAAADEAYVAEPPVMAEEPVSDARESRPRAVFSEEDAWAAAMQPPASSPEPIPEQKRSISAPQPQSLRSSPAASAGRLEEKPSESDEAAFDTEPAPPTDPVAAGLAASQRVPSAHPEAAPTPEQRVDEIRELIEQGRHTDALNLLHLMRIQHPDFELPPDLKAYISGEQRAPSAQP